jgi:hypothetical protein
VPFEPTQSEAPVLTRMAPSSATLPKIFEASWPWLWRHTWNATRCECIDSVTATGGIETGEGAQDRAHVAV